ncbi:hypothetical protein E3P99_00101 [Wallemia hederae]|uniref:Serine/threonine-protein phosphatase n=1 Tax=Wallemia hederae TaxID=1540922 RepID=A0A4T0G2H2_9BASI|nr:hypothetical protein E3P99_00101 [Wallemia hederae]
MTVDPQQWLDTILSGNYLAESEIKMLCDVVLGLLIEESNIQPVSSPVTVCGDIHGQFWDLLELLRVGGDCRDTNYIFMGDFVDRGHQSLESFTLLMALKARYPDRITLLRGNHESRQITQVYGFYDECQQKYGNASVWKACCQVFDYLNLAAIIDGKILCVHGGLSPDVRTLDQIRVIARAQEIPHDGPFCDLMWSDPDDVEHWSISPRGAGWLFGSKVTKEFNHINGLDMIARAHQLIQEGYKFMFPDNDLVTVWSAPNYCYRCGNVASVLKVKEYESVTEENFAIFDAVADQDRGSTARVAPSQYLLTRSITPVKAFPIASAAAACAPAPALIKRNFANTPVHFRERIHKPEIEPPVKPKSPYLRYMHYLIEEEKKIKPYAKINPIEFGQRVASPAWESLFDSQKMLYETSYQDDYKLYKPLERDWWMSKTYSDISYINDIRRENNMKPLSVPAEYRKEWSRLEREARQADKLNKTKGIANARNRFMSEVIPQLSKDLGDSKDAMRVASAKWKELPDDEREPYQQAFLKEKAERGLLKA